MVKVGFTGTRHGMTREQKDNLHWELFTLVRDYPSGADHEFHHGDCIGADAEACEIARNQGFKIHRHPPSDPSRQAFTEFDVDYPPIPYKDRNRRIVFLTQWLIACPDKYPWVQKGGTWYTYNHCVQQGSYKRHMVIEPSGIFHTSSNWSNP